MIITQHENPAEYAPSFFFNHCGRMPWSGRSQSDLSGVEVVELLQFCEGEGGRQGHNDATQDRIGDREQAPFHEAFLGGYPKQVWENAYWKGVHGHRQFLELAALDAMDTEDGSDGIDAAHMAFETDQHLIAALPLNEEFGVSRVQRLTRWGYNKTSQKLKELAIQKLIIQVEGEPNRYRREWPEAPEKVFIGADPLHKPSK